MLFNSVVFLNVELCKNAFSSSGFSVVLHKVRHILSLNDNQHLHKRRYAPVAFSGLVVGVYRIT